MEKFETDVVGFAFGILIVIVLSLACAFKATYESGYKDACGDFYKGKLKYDLVVNEDGTREWKKVKPKGVKND